MRTKAQELEQKLKINFKGIKLDLQSRQTKPRHPKALEMVNVIQTIDSVCFCDELDIRTGGEGDNGETLLCILDIYFEAKDRQEAEYIRNHKGRE